MDLLDIMPNTNLGEKTSISTFLVKQYGCVFIGLNGNKTTKQSH